MIKIFLLSLLWLIIVPRVLIEIIDFLNKLINFLTKSINKLRLHKDSKVGINRKDFKIINLMIIENA